MGSRIPTHLVDLQIANRPNAHHPGGFTFSLLSPTLSRLAHPACSGTVHQSSN